MTNNMKTQEEILARYQADESADFFGAQRLALLCLLPYEAAKPYLHPDYVKGVEDDTLPEEEKWKEGFDPKEDILEFIPQLYLGIQAGDQLWAMQSLLYVKSWIWATEPELYDKIAPEYEGDFLDCGKGIVDKLATHFNYKPDIEEVPFEEVPVEEPKDK